jgi:predicted Zn-ribbon and HTH transcriptional regulator
MSGGTEYALRLREVEAENKRLRSQLSEREREVERLRQAHWDGRAIGGFDNDGDPDPKAIVSDFAALIIDDWTHERANYDAACEETERLERERDEARAAHRRCAEGHAEIEDSLRREVEALKSRPAACTDCGEVFASIEALDDAGRCDDCRSPPPPETETPEERHERIVSWSCPEPGCSILGPHEGKHRAMIGHGDIDTIEWTEPGAYLAALRPLARGSEEGT